VRNGDRRCSCRRHADLGRIREILSHVLVCRELPEFMTIRERSLVLRSLVMHVPHGNGFGCPTYCLTWRGQEVLLELDTNRTTKRKEAVK
jgi:hypothetical protein